MPTPLKTKIEQLLTEARVMIPGGQALLGFQFIATLTKAFSELPQTIHYLHALGLIAVALAVMLLMTPAALHRLAYRGEDDSQFFRIGSGVLIADALPLALGVSADVTVVFYKVFQSAKAGGAAGIMSFSALIGLWYVFPLLCRPSKGNKPLTVGRRWHG
jgi:Family of unknown function (DUF6328)